MLNDGFTARAAFLQGLRQAADPADWPELALLLRRQAAQDVARLLGSDEPEGPRAYRRGA